MAPRVSTVHLGLGPIGLGVARIVGSRPFTTSVGAVDIDPALIGRDLGSLTGGAPSGIVVKASLAEVGRPGSADVVVHCAGSHLRDVASQLEDALGWGASVVSTCEELSFPWYHHPEEARRIDASARRAGRAVLATGVNPGFAMDVLALYVSGACERVESVRVRRVVDASTRRGSLQAKIGAGISVDEFRRRQDAGTIGHVGLPESVAMIAAGFGWELDSISETLEPVLADRPITTPHSSVIPGAVAGIHQVARGAERGTERVTLTLDMYVGAPDPADTVELDGRPSLTTTLRGLHGDISTAAIAANAVRAIPDLPPGLLTMLDVSQIRFHAR